MPKKLNIAETRASFALSQAKFAKLLGIPVGTLRDWEQGKRNPSGAARTLLVIAGKYPDVLRGLNDH